MGEETIRGILATARPRRTRAARIIAIFGLGAALLLGVAEAVTLQRLYQAQQICLPSP